MHLHGDSVSITLENSFSIPVITGVNFLVVLLDFPPPPPPIKYWPNDKLFLASVIFKQPFVTCQLSFMSYINRFSTSRRIYCCQTLKISKI